MGGGGKKGGKVEVTDFRMSLHMGWCNGPCDAMLGFYAGEKAAWEGNSTGEEAIHINQINLFGGPTKEGGVEGTMYRLPGGSTQVMPEQLAAKLGRTSATCPGFRGIETTFFYGAPDGPYPGFLWASNNPYLKTIWARFKRSPKVLDPSLRMVSRFGFKISRSGSTVTVDGVSATLPDNSATLVNGVTILINGTTTKVNGTTIVVDYANKKITIDGATYENTLSASNALIAVHATGDTKLSVGMPEGEDANPAAIIYECLTNGDWGMGAPASIIDIDSFTACATTLRNEGFGMSMRWTRQDTIENFVSEVIDHINATLFVNPRTGKLTLKLIRADYNIEDLPVLDPTNCRVTAFDRKGWGETTNEIVVTWTNPENEGEETVGAQHDANISIQGCVVSDSRNYYGVRYAGKAMELAQRDLAVSAAPLAAVEIEADRLAWDFVPGGCAVLNYPEYGIEGLVIRFGKIDYGKSGAPIIKINAMEDVFALPVASYTTPPSSAWVDPSQPPSAMNRQRAMTAPAFFAAAALNANIDSATYPDVIAAVLGSTDNVDCFGYELQTEAVDPLGATGWQREGNKAALVSGQLSALLPAQAVSTGVTFNSMEGAGVAPGAGGFVFIGDVTEQNHEIAMITAAGGTFTLRRGLFDTTPKTWPAGTVCWFVEKDTAFLDTATIRAEGELAKFKLLTRTSLGLLDISLATQITATLTGRPHYPFRPANLKVNGVGFGNLILPEIPPDHVTVTWSNRNRLLEDTTPLAWTDATAAVEAGQTTTLYVISAFDGSIVNQYDGLTGTTFDIPFVDFGGQSRVYIKATAKRDGLESLQGHSVLVWAAAGYGYGYGLNYGGA